MRTIGKKAVAVLVPSGVTAALMLGSINTANAEPCIGLPAKVGSQSLVALVNVGVQDIAVVPAPQNLQCAENSTQAKGDEPLSHILDNIPVLSRNGTGNG